MNEFVTIKASTLRYYLKVASILGHKGTFVCGFSQSDSAASDPEKLSLWCDSEAFHNLNATQSLEDLLF